MRERRARVTLSSSEYIQVYLRLAGLSVIAGNIVLIEHWTVPFNETRKMSDASLDLKPPLNASGANVGATLTAMAVKCIGVGEDRRW
jgi:hypothetical protein